MHNIKFRVWNISQKRFMSEYPLSSICECLHDITHGIKNKYFVLQQFTDMLDKDGTEIYVGDLIKTPGNLIKCVIFQRGRFCLADGSLLQVNPDGRSIYAKVVGNIFEEYHGT